MSEPITALSALLATLGKLILGAIPAALGAALSLRLNTRDLTPRARLMADKAYLEKMIAEAGGTADQRLQAQIENQAKLNALVKERASLPGGQGKINEIDTQLGNAEKLKNIRGR